MYHAAYMVNMSRENELSVCCEDGKSSLGINSRQLSFHVENCLHPFGRAISRCSAWGLALGILGPTFRIISETHLLIIIVDGTSFELHSAPRVLRSSKIGRH